jgi:conjugal transfer pilus assembly protein TraA
MTHEQTKKEDGVNQYFSTRLNRIKPVAAKAVSASMMLGATIAVGAAVSFAGTDTTFDTVVTQVNDWTSGSMGRLVTGSSLVVATLNAVMGFRWAIFGGAVATALATSFGPNVMNTMVSATF